MNVGTLDPLLLALFLGSLSLLPLFMIVCTCFLKISMVLLITRNAIGVQQVPPNMAVYGIALAATLFVMAPVFSDMGERLKDDSIDLTSLDTLQDGARHVLAPLQQFMSRNTDPDILTHLMDNSARMWPAEMASKVKRDDFLLIVPAFVLSELQAGFKIGFLVYIPLIVIDYSFFTANLVKLGDGGWFPLAIGSGVFIIGLVFDFLLVVPPPLLLLLVIVIVLEIVRDWSLWLGWRVCQRLPARQQLAPISGLLLPNTLLGYCW